MGRKGSKTSFLLNRLRGGGWYPQLATGPDFREESENAWFRHANPHTIRELILPRKSKPITSCGFPRPNVEEKRFLCLLRKWVDYKKAFVLFPDDFLLIFPGYPLPLLSPAPGKLFHDSKSDCDSPWRPNRNFDKNSLEGFAIITANAL